MTMRKLLLVLAAAGMIAGAFSCGKENGNDDPNNEKKDAQKEVTHINVVQIQQKTIALAVDGTAKIDCVIYPASADISYGHWESSDKNVVKIVPPYSTRYANIQAVGEGEATITAVITDEAGTTRKGKTLVVVSSQAQQTLDNKDLLEEVILNKTEVSVGIGESVSITASPSPSTASNPDILFDISNNLEFVSWEGNTITVKGARNGIGWVSAESAYNEEIKTVCQVNVGKPVEKINLDKQEAINLEIGDDFTVNVVQVLPQGASWNDVYFEANESFLQFVKKTNTSCTVKAIKAGAGNILAARTSWGNAITYVYVSTNAKPDPNQKPDDAIDLGLSVYWGTKNLGATKTDGALSSCAGNYYAWGETSTKYRYNGSTYRYFGEKSSITKYTTSEYENKPDNKTRLDLSDDAAHAVLGGKWRMPTYSEWLELLATEQNTSIFTWQEYTTNGTRIKSIYNKVTKGSIDIPMVNYKKDSEEIGDKHAYWTSSLSPMNDSYALVIDFSSNLQCWPEDVCPDFCRKWGAVVRPVWDPTL